MEFSERDIVLLFIQLVPIIGVWVRLESRLSKLEGQFGMFFKMTDKALQGIEKRRGFCKEGE